MRAGQPVSLEPKTFDVLRYLLEHRDRLVTKEELLDSVWKDTFVTPNVLTRAVAQMRKALGDDAFEARYVETVAKRGYRFIAPVHVSQDPNASTPAIAAGNVSESEAVPVSAPPADPKRRRVTIAAAVLAAVALAATVLYTVRERGTSVALETATSPFAARRFTTESHSYSFPSISPDGRTVAYSSDATGSMEIYTSSFVAGSEEHALTSDGGHNMFAEWSPDGQWIAYHSRKKGGIWIVPSGGGTARQVVDFGSQPTWTPDGQSLVFSSDAGGMAAQSVLWTVRVDGTSRRQLTKLGAPRGGHSRPSVSPTGRLVTFAVSHGHLITEIWTASIDGSAKAKIGLGATPHFSPAGDAVFWVGRTMEGNDTLVRAAITADGVPIGEPQTIKTFTGTFVGDFSIARDGTSVFWFYQAPANLWSVDIPAHGMARAIPLTSDDVRNTSRGTRVAA